MYDNNAKIQLNIEHNHMPHDPDITSSINSAQIMTLNTKDIYIELRIILKIWNYVGNMINISC